MKDLARTITIEQLKQQYRLDTKKLVKAIELERSNLNKVEKELNNYIEIFTNNLENLQDQVDGNITTWFFSGIPTLLNYPTNEWLTDNDKNNHLGDLYYDKNTGYSYRFSLEESEYKWIKLTDNDITEALALANSAKDTADSKRRVFLIQPIPPYDNGDMWIKNNEIWICQISKGTGETFSNSDFINNLKYTDDTFATEVDGKLTVVSGRVTEVETGISEINQKVEENKYFIDSEGNQQLISSSMTEFTQNLQGLEAEVNSFNTNLDENYYTKEITEQFLIDTTNGLTNTFVTSGGNNLLRNTAPWYMESETTAEFWNGVIKQVVEIDAVSGYAILTQQGIISQGVTLAKGNYSLSFRYKKLIASAECTVRYNGKTFELTEESGEIHSSGEVDGPFVIEITANSNNGFEIYDLMLKHGIEGTDNMLVWTQNANESRSDTVQISQGITANSNTTDTKATMGAEGFKVINKTSGLSVMEATATGGLFRDLTSKGKSNVSGLLIRKDGNQVKLNGESGS